MLTNSEYDSISLKVKNSLLDHSYHQTVTGVIASFIIAGLAFINLLHTNLALSACYWYVFYIFAGIIRLIAYIHYTKKTRIEINYKHSNINLFCFMSSYILTGLAWGFLAVYFFPLGGMTDVITIMLLAGTTAGSIPLLSGTKYLAYCYVILILGPLALNGLMHANKYYLFGVSIITYTIFLCLLIHKNHNFLYKAIMLKYENIDLLKNLTDAKNQLEVINLKLEQSATHDPLTNVGNRNLFVEMFDKSINYAKSNNKIMALLYMDLDKFKEVNDTYGHHIGDALLLAVITRLHDIFRKSDYIFRLGGDEFAVIIDDVSSTDYIIQIAKRTCDALKDTFILDGFEIKIGISIGISRFPTDAQTANDLISIADKNMYFAKNEGGNNFKLNS
ncbi:MAG: GGDEF domain-containing protein [Gammaproteobacteria bacterium]|nr:GGDEF domain-containing protein [Gammaproteobacteria bacterium]